MGVKSCNCFQLQLINILISGMSPQRSGGYEPWKYNGPVFEFHPCQILVVTVELPCGNFDSRCPAKEATEDGRNGWDAADGWTGRRVVQRQ